MSRADPCPFARLRDTIGTGAPRRRVIPPAVRFLPAPGVDPPCRSENRAHRCGVAIGIAGCCGPRRPDAQTRAQYGGLTTVERRMAPDQRPVTPALGGFESGIDDFEQVRHRLTRPWSGTSLRSAPLGHGREPTPARAFSGARGAQHNSASCGPAGASRRCWCEGGQRCSPAPHSRLRLRGAASSGRPVALLMPQGSSAALLGVCARGAPGARPEETARAATPRVAHAVRGVRERHRTAALAAAFVRRFCGAAVSGRRRSARFRERARGRKARRRGRGRCGWRS
jgi:hypothetical protein